MIHHQLPPLPQLLPQPQPLSQPQLFAAQALPQPPLLPQPQKRSSRMMIHQQLLSFPQQFPNISIPPWSVLIVYNTPKAKKCACFDKNLCTKPLLVSFWLNLARGI